MYEFLLQCGFITFCMFFVRFIHRYIGPRTEAFVRGSTPLITMILSAMFVMTLGWAAIAGWAIPMYIHAMAASGWVQGQRLPHDFHWTDIDPVTAIGQLVGVATGLYFAFRATEVAFFLYVVGTVLARIYGW